MLASHQEIDLIWDACVNSIEKQAALNDQFKEKHMTDYHHSNKSSNILHKIYGNNMKFDIKLTRDFLLEKLLN